MSDAVKIQNNETALLSWKESKYTQKCQIQIYTHKMNDTGNKALSKGNGSGTEVQVHFLEELKTKIYFRD